MEATPIVPSEVIRSIVEEALLTTVELHQRRCAIKAGVRESLELIDGCDHADWNHGKRWCNRCGVTAEELYFGRRDGSQ